ncbi:hypothetical protein JQK15_13565 [Sphingobium sp. BHU LFT2]|uniref:hypothetical protein n=1 Tax=Sphingobium sp. BHU LFT2 TaxID=2807634 RepID=UPI001BE7DFD1|nr:hypothetical protein [Sphingobium sp. BHU LFT2]MBT2244567.1 hypothetical protein [Sphingobium sp. BHU LFT2]
MEFTDPNFIAIATVVAAFIAATVAAATLISAKESKVSEFRQDWIDEQRKDLATAIAATLAYFNADAAKERSTFMKEFFEARMRIELREKPTDHEWTRVRVAVACLGNMMLHGKLDMHKVRQAERIIICNSRPVLKQHWETAKNGERFYKGIKWTFLIGVGALVALGVLLAIFQPISRRSDDAPGVSVKITRPG